MKKLIIIITTFILALGICSSAFAIVPTPLGKTDAEQNNLLASGYTDYRGQWGVFKDSSKKPTAQFTIQVGNQSVSSPRGNVLDVETPSITMTNGQSVSILDSSSATKGTTRVVYRYDFQYRIVPDGQDRTSIPIVADFFSSWSAVQQRFAKAVSELETAGTNANLELYLNVSDVTRYSSDENWSANGNVAVTKVDKNFPNGIIWYFSGMVIEYKTGAPDFYPLPQGATEYQEWYKDCAMSYEGNAGDPMDIPVGICNSGQQAITNVAATWFGSGWDNPVFKQDNLDIAQGQYQDLTIPVTVPQPKAETRLVVKVNVDDNTPAGETNPDNNTMIIKVIPKVPDFWPGCPTGTAFTGQPGATITIPAVVWNNGVQETTDFAACWDGGDWSNPVTKQDNLTIDQGQKVDTPFTVTVPNTKTKLWLRANVDGNTPASEVKMDNNTLGITVGPDTADVAVSISVSNTSPEEMDNVVTTVTVVNNGPADADVSLQVGENNGSNWTISKQLCSTKTFSLASGGSQKFNVNTGGHDAGFSTYIAAIASVTNTTDPNLNNNYARSKKITWVGSGPAITLPPERPGGVLIH